MTGTWGTPGELLPTLPGKAPGIVGMDFSTTPATVTAQCAVCLRTYTDMSVLALRQINHEGDLIAEPFMYGPSTKYRRCSDCRSAKRHLEEAAECGESA